MLVGCAEVFAGGAENTKIGLQVAAFSVLERSSTGDRLALFDSRLTDYFWDVDSTGKMHGQLRFCPVSTIVAP